MKPILALIFSLFLLSSLASAQKKQAVPNYTLRGTFTGKHSHAIFLDYKDSNGKRIRRKAYVKNGKFIFKGWISSPVYAFLVGDIKVTLNKKPDVSNGTEMFLSPGEMTVSLQENDFEHAKITGSIMQRDYNDFEMQRQAILKSKDSLEFLMNKLRQKVNTAGVHKAYLVLLDKLDKFDEKDNLFEYHFIKTHPNSYLSAYLLDNCFDPGEDLSLDSAEIFYNLFTPVVKNSIAGLLLRKKITECKASAVGSMMKLPRGVDVNGKMTDLSPLMHKGYIIFDFWASWCSPCNLENMHLKQLYNKYHAQGLDVIAISNDDYKKFWRDTIKKQGISMWHNIMAENVANLDNFYNMQMMAPSLFILVDKQGVIIGRYRGASTIYKRDYDEGTIADMDKKLTRLFPNN